MIDYDDTFSLNPTMFKQLWNLLEHAGFICKICTARGQHLDNNDIFQHVNEEDVIFCDGLQKKDILISYGINRSDVAFWIDDCPEAIVDKEDLFGLMYYFNN